MKDKKCYREVIEKDLDKNYLKYLARKEKENDRYDFYGKLNPLICTMAAYIQQ